MAQSCRSQVQCRLAVWTCADNAGTSSDFTQNAFQRMVGADAPPVLLGEGVVQRLLDRHFHKLGRFGNPLAAQLLGNSSALWYAAFLSNALI